MKHRSCDRLDTLLTTGLREREAMHLEWSDFDFAHKTLQVKSKPRYGHKIKDSEEREMPLTKELVEQLKKYREANEKGRLVHHGTICVLRPKRHSPAVSASSMKEHCLRVRRTPNTVSHLVTVPMTQGQFDALCRSHTTKVPESFNRLHC